MPHVSRFSEPALSAVEGWDARQLASEGFGLMRLACRGPRLTKAPTSRKEREKWGTPIVLIAGDVGHPAAPKVKDTTLGA